MGEPCPVRPVLLSRTRVSAAGRAGRCTQDVPCATAPVCPARQNATEHAPSLNCGSPSHSEKALLQAVLPSRAAAPGALAATRSIRSGIGLFLRIFYLP